MNAPEDERLANSDPKANAEIKNGSGNALNIKNEPKKKHEKSHFDPEYPNTSSTEQKGKVKELELIRKDLENANSRIIELKEKEKELGLLRKDLEDANSRIKELEGKKREMEILRKDLEKETTPPKEHMTDKQKIEETFSEHTSHGKEAFRIDLYPYEGHYQGKVEHLLTKEKKAFKGIDHEAIADFINEHLSQPEESFPAPETVKLISAKPTRQTQMQVLKTASIRKFTIVLQDNSQKERSIPNDQFFRVSLVVDPPESIAEDEFPCLYNISIFGKRMGGNFKQIMGKSNGEIKTAGEFIVNTRCAPLHPGIYRFVALGTITIKNSGKESIILFHESKIFFVDIGIFLRT
jgi:hypothetical protein